MNIACYDTDLTDAQWHLLQPHLPKAARRGRPRTDLRRILNAALYVVKSGVQWRLPPKSFPPWQTVYHVFRRWCRNGTWEYRHARLRALVRAAAGKDCRPTAGILDSQSVKSDPHGGAVGYDAGKQIKGRKRHLLVDTLGLALGVAASPASTPERARRPGPAGPRPGLAEVVQTPLGGWRLRRGGLRRASPPAPPQARGRGGQAQ